MTRVRARAKTSEIHPIFEKFNSLTMWGRTKRLMRGIIGLLFVPVFFFGTIMFLLVELGNYTLDILVEEGE